MQSPRFERSPNVNRKRKFELPNTVIPSLDQDGYEYEEDSADIWVDKKFEKEERQRVENTLRGAAYKLYKFRTCKSQVSHEEWLELIGKRVPTELTRIDAGET